MKKLEDYGFIQSRPKGEYHANNQQMSKLLHHAVGLGGKGSAPQVCCRDLSCQPCFVPGGHICPYYCCGAAIDLAHSHGLLWNATSQLCHSEIVNILSSLACIVERIYWYWKLAFSWWSMYMCGPLLESLSAKVTFNLERLRLSVSLL